MHSLIHCVWTGHSFPYSVRSFLKAWLTYLRHSNSDFKVVVWLTDDSLEAAKKYLSEGLGNKFDEGSKSKCFSGINLLFYKAKIGFSSFYIGSLEPLFVRQKPQVLAAVRDLHKHKYYTSVSNIARVLLVNACGGIYTDVDYLYPNPKVVFPKNMNEIISVFAGASSIDFYLPVIFLDTSSIIENQCLVLPPENIGALDELIISMTAEIRARFDDIKHATLLHTEFLESPVTKSLSKSMFTDPQELPLLKAFKRHRLDEYERASLELYKHQDHTIVNTYPGSYFYNPEPIIMLDSNGTRCHFYGPISESTYITVTRFFKTYLRSSTDEYVKIRWGKFREFFSPTNMDQQFTFYDERGLRKGVYTWSHPGYGRLTALQKAVGVVEKHYIPKESGTYPVRLVLALIADCKVILLQCTETNPRKEMLELDNLRKTVETNFKEDVLKMPSSLFLLKEIFSTMSSFGCFKTLADKLNTEKYKAIRITIDPEKKSLAPEDIEGFILT